MFALNYRSSVPGRCGSSGLPLGAFQQTFCLAARSRIEEKLSERLCQNGLELRHDGLDVRRDHMSIERSLVLPALERQEAARLANDFHQRVDQTPRLLGGRFGEGNQQRAEFIRLVLLGYDFRDHEVAALSRRLGG